MRTTLLPAFLPFFSRRQPLQGLCILPASHVQFLCLVAPLSPFSYYVSTCYSLWNFKGKKSPLPVWVPNMESVFSCFQTNIEFFIVLWRLLSTWNVFVYIYHMNILLNYFLILVFHIAKWYRVHISLHEMLLEEGQKRQRGSWSLWKLVDQILTHHHFCGLIFLVILIIFKLFLLTCLTSHWNIPLVSRNKRFAHR